MADYWIELHCDMRHDPLFAHSCYSNCGDSPGVMLSTATIPYARSLVHDHAVKAGWRVGKGVALCPICRKKVP